MAAERDQLGGRQPRRYRLLLARSFAVLALLLSGLYLGRGWLLAPLVVRYARSLAARELGAELEIGSLRGSWIRDLELSGVSWRAPGPPLRRAEQASLNARFSLLRLLRGRPDWLEDLAIRARGVELDLTSRRERDEGAARSELAIPALELEVQDASVKVARDLDPLRVDTCAARGSLEPGRVLIDELRARSGENGLEVRGAALELRPAGPGRPPRIEELLRAARGELDLSIRDPAAVQWAGPGRDLPVRSLELRVALAAGLARVEGRAELEGGHVLVRRGELALADGQELTGATIDAALEVELTDLAPLGVLLGQELRGNLTGELVLSGKLLSPSGHVEARGSALAAAGMTLDRFEVELETDGRQARIQRLEAVGPGLEAQLSGGVRFQPLEFESFELALSSADPGRFLARLAPAGAIEARARLSGPPARLDGDFELASSKPVLGRLALDEIRARGRVSGGAFEVDELVLQAPSAVLRAAGRVQPAGDRQEVELASLELESGGARLANVGPARGVIATNLVRLERLELAAGGGGSGRAILGFEWRPGETRGSIELVDLDARPLGSWLPGWELGVVRGRLEGALTPAGPELAGELETAALRFPGEEAAWETRLAGELAGGRLRLGELAARSSLGETVEGSLDVPFDPARPLELPDGEVTLALEIRAEDLGTLQRRFSPSGTGELLGSATLAARLTGSWTRLGGSLQLSAAGLAFSDPFGGRSFGPAALESQLVLGESVRIEALEVSSEYGHASLRGELGFPGDLARLRAEPGALREAPLTLEAELELPEIAWATGLSRELRRLGGGVSGRLALDGTLSRPSFSGELHWRRGELRLATNAPAARGIEADLSFEDRLVRVDSLTGELGGAPVRASGTLDLSGAEPQIELSLEGQNVLLARDAHLRLRADARLSARGPLQGLEIGGELELTEGRYSYDIDLLQQLLEAGEVVSPQARGGPIALWREPPLSQAGLDVRITSQRGLELDTNLLEATFRPELVLTGSGAAPTLEGPVYVDQASLTLPSGNMRLVSGILEFRAEQPFRPRLALTGEMRVRGYAVQGTATGSLEELELALSSDPPLASDDLWVLVLTGQPPTEAGESKSAQAMESLAIFLARDRVVRWFSSGSSDTSDLFERFEIDVGAEASKSGQSTGRVLFYLEPRTARSNRALYLSAELDEYDRTNFGLGIVFRPR